MHCRRSSASPDWLWHGRSTQKQRRCATATCRMWSREATCSKTQSVKWPSSSRNMTDIRSVSSSCSQHHLAQTSHQSTDQHSALMGKKVPSSSSTSTLPKSWNKSWKVTPSFTSVRMWSCKPMQKSSGCLNNWELTPLLPTQPILGSFRGQDYGGQGTPGMTKTNTHWRASN